MSSHNQSQKAVPSRVTLPNIIAQPRSRRLYQATVNKLPDDVFLDIFDFYLNGNVPDRIQSLDEWHTLVHVCRRWRNLVFASPRRLNLQLLCKKDRPVREMLDIWPALPIAIRDHWIRTWEAGQVNIAAALKHPDRVRSIVLDNISVRSLGYLTAVMRVPFPELTHLDLWWSEEAGLSNPVLTNSFLGGSAPGLRTLTLSGIIFPALPNLLLSAGDLVDLSLSRLPHSGYISPEAMVACLSSMNRLKSLDLGFESPRSRPDQPSPPPQTRIVLPALTNLAFEGMAHYSEDLLARIDTPVLNKFSMTFFLDLVDIPHFKLLIDRAKGFKPSKAAMLLFDQRASDSN
ncbi:hypothetical protein BC826DRAFT_1107952 [Russula brevipes]|nr:hypothetical protein BC826DRAFT_1107952 [Russula brevipes]